MQLRYSGNKGSILIPTEILERRSGKGGGQITGVVGCLKWHYYTASDVRGYTVRRDAAGVWALTGQIVNPNAYNLAQRPLRFVAPYQGGEWRWPVESIEIRDGLVRATLGAPLP